MHPAARGGGALLASGGKDLPEMFVNEMCMLALSSNTQTHTHTQSRANVCSNGSQMSGKKAEIVPVPDVELLLCHPLTTKQPHTGNQHDTTGMCTA